ncbi:TetR/AcrR family transcriptional regulator [Pseudonocardia sp. DLS-67]
MVRPRFARLPPEQQQVILHAALDEFSAHGFHDASLNRVIDAAGISKGSMYYYFDSKEDLYAHVARVEFERFFTDLGPLVVPPETDPDTFWSTLERYYLDAITRLGGSPQLTTLIRGWLAALGNPTLQQAQHELERAVLPWVERAVTTGQSIGAVRTDLPADLLIAVLLGMGQAMDTWLIAQQPGETDLPRLVSILVGMIRRTLEP